MTTFLNKKKKKSSSVSDEKEIQFSNSTIFKDTSLYQYPSDVIKNPQDYIPVRELDLNIIPPSTENYLDPSITGSKIVVIGKPGTGKCLHPETELLTSDLKLIKAKDVTVDTILIGDDFTERRVLGTTKGKDILYKIEQEYGVSYVVNSVHILTLYKNGQYIDVEIKDVQQYLQDGWKGVRNLPYCPKCDDCKECDIDIKEYLEDSKTLLFTPVNKRFSLLKNMMKEYDGFHFHLKDKYYTIPSVSLITAQKLQLLCNSIGIKSAYFINDVEEYTVRVHINHKHVQQLTLPEHRRIESRLIVKRLIEDTYVGFELNGNGRFLLSDFTVTHNTSLIKSILYEKQSVFPIGVVYSGTEDSNHAYQKFIPDLFVFNEYEEVNFENFKKRQDASIKYLIPPEHNPWAYILVDDCTDEPKIFNRKIWQACYKNGRHWKMLHILSLQYCMDLKRSIRFTIDGVFILRETNLQLRESLYKNYGGNIPSFEVFCDLMDQITEDYTALYIHNRTTTNDYRDCIFYYKPKIDKSKGGVIPDDWRSGCADYWDYHDARCLKEN